jgi:putative membrane protein
MDGSFGGVGTVTEYGKTAAVQFWETLHMGDSMERQTQLPDPRVHFAAERTLLAWIRTGLAMMGFGFVVARFGLFLRELASVKGAVPPHRVGMSLAIGTTLVLLGVIVTLCAAVKHWRTVGRLDRNEPLRFHPLSLGVVIAVSLGLLGLLTAAYLLFWLGEPH